MRELVSEARGRIDGVLEKGRFYRKNHRAGWRKSAFKSRLN